MVALCKVVCVRVSSSRQCFFFSKPILHMTYRQVTIGSDLLRPPSFSPTAKASQTYEHEEGSRLIPNSKMCLKAVKVNKIDQS